MKKKREIFEKPVFEKNDFVFNVTLKKELTLL